MPTQITCYLLILAMYFPTQVTSYLLILAMYFLARAFSLTYMEYVLHIPMNISWTKIDFINPEERKYTVPFLQHGCHENPLSASFTVIHSKTFWQVTRQLYLASKRLAATKASKVNRFSYSHNGAWSLPFYLPSFTVQWSSSNFHL